MRTLLEKTSARLTEVIVSSIQIRDRRWIGLVQGLAVGPVAYHYDIKYRPMFQTPVMVADARTTPSGTCTALTGPSTAVVQGRHISFQVSFYV